MFTDSRQVGCGILEFVYRVAVRTRLRSFRRAIVFVFSTGVFVFGCYAAEHPAQLRTI